MSFHAAESDLFFSQMWHTGFMESSCGESEHYMSCEHAAYADTLKTELLLWPERSLIIHWAVQFGCQITLSEKM